MVIFKIKELLEKKDMSRYELQKETNWNYKRINAFFFNKVKKVSLEEIEKLCEIFECDLIDLMILEKKK